MLLMKNNKQSTMLSFIILLLFFKINITQLNANYDSVCIKPKFSKNENYIAYWDFDPKKFSGAYKKFTLYIYNIKECRKEKLLERTFDAMVDGYYLEIMEEFQNVRWTKDGKFLLVSLDGLHLELIDVNSKKIKSRIYMNDSVNSSLFIGYFSLKWVDNEKMVIGYISNKTNLKNTDDAYGLIEIKNEKIIILNKMLDKNSKYIPRKNNIVKKEKHPILFMNKNNTIYKFKIIEENLLFPSEIFDLVQINSNQRVLLSLSPSGKLGIVSGVKKLTNEKNLEIFTKLIKIQDKFADKLSLVKSRIDDD